MYVCFNAVAKLKGFKVSRVKFNLERFNISTIKINYYMAARS
jgi:hypothetical protein